MNKAQGRMVRRVEIALGIVLLTAVAGCLGYVDGGYGGAVVVPEPDVVIFGGGYYGGGYYERGRDVHEYSHRGSASRVAAHPVAAHPVSGGHEKKR